MALAGTFAKLDETARMVMARQTLTSEALEMARQVIEVQTEALLRLRAEGDSLRAIVAEVRAMAVERNDLTLLSVMDSRLTKESHEG